MNYFGKPEQCYKCHVESVYKSWAKLYQQKEDSVNTLCKNYGIFPERFKAASLLTVAFHDAGKPSLSFQQSMYEIVKKEGLAQSTVSCKSCNQPIAIPFLTKKAEQYRHEIVSGLAAIYVSSKLDDSMGQLMPGGFPFEFLAVIGHHKPVNPESFRREWERFSDEADELEKTGYGKTEWDHIFEIAKNIFASKNITIPDIEWHEVSSNGHPVIEIVKNRIDTIPVLVQDAIYDTGQTYIIGRIRETLALLKSLLISADWEGSSKKEIHLSISTSVDDFWNTVKCEIETDSKKAFKIREFQRDLTNLHGHGIAVAPTGSGKTEGAIAWALKNKSSNGKILYVLPNQVLTNSIYERFCKYFGKGKVGLLHSGALLYQILSRIDTDEADQYDQAEPSPTEDEKDLHTLNRMMFRPIMVTTVDQLLMIAFNGNKRWSVIMGEVMGGTIIFDEVHAYDGHMLALLERVTRELRNYSKMLFMSATMPKNLIDFLSRLLGVEGTNHIVRDDTLLKQSRNIYKPVTDSKGNFKSLLEREKLSKAVVNDMDGFIRQGKRVLIICNTVNTTQTVYNQLKDKYKDAMCLHSRFISKDRRAKEKDLEKDKTKTKQKQAWPQILVATQVVECGMDIDYDVIFTEGAPLEAIIQRAGRVNRERDQNDKGLVYIFKQDKETSHKFYPPEIVEKGLNILKRKADSNPEIIEEELINMVEELYNGKKFEDDLRFLNTRRVLDELIYDVGAVHDLPETDLHTRFITYKMVEVVPEGFWAEIKDKNQFAIMEHLVKMPLWAYLRAKSYETSDKWKDEWKVIQMKYDSEIGGTFEENIKSRLKSEIFFA